MSGAVDLLQLWGMARVILLAASIFHTTDFDQTHLNAGFSQLIIMRDSVVVLFFMAADRSQLRQNPRTPRRCEPNQDTFEG